MRDWGGAKKGKREGNSALLSFSCFCISESMLWASDSVKGQPKLARQRRRHAYRLALPSLLLLSFPQIAELLLDSEM